MNVFYLDSDPVLAAQYHCDKHCVKMIIEYAQLLSTAHRMLDGELYIDKTLNGRNIKRWRIDDEREGYLYKASHTGHPSSVWTRASIENYYWLHELFVNLCEEYTVRYGKIHATQSLNPFICVAPMNIPNVSFTEPPPAMPDYCKVHGDSVSSYRKYYLNEKPFAKWKTGNVPEWYTETA